MNKNLLKENESLDDLECKGLKLIQNKNGYKFSTDSVLLANFAKGKQTDRYVDLCSGSGVVAILFACKNNIKEAYAVEIQSDLADMCRRSLEYNNLENIKVLNIDLSKTHEVLGNESVDVVTINPPYNEQGKTSNMSQIAMATHEISTNLNEICMECFKLLKFGGKLFMVHRADRLVDILFFLRQNKLEPKVIRIVYPKANKQPNLVLIEAKKGAKKGIKFIDPLIITNDDGSESDETKKIYNRNI